MTLTEFRQRRRGLKCLVRVANTNVGVLISGKEADRLVRQLGGRSYIGLAEHGSFLHIQVRREAP